jgi:hypothetical protein
MTIIGIFAGIGMIWVAYHACRLALEWAETSRAIRDSTGRSSRSCGTKPRRSGRE